MDLSKLIDKLGRLGFSVYEAKAYLSLLKNSPATGYEIAKGSGIPPSKIYEVVSKLLARSVVSPLSGKPVKYIPQNIKVFLKNQKNDFNDTLDFLDKNLPSLGDSVADYLWNVHDYADFMKRAQNLISAAEKEIILLGWDSELELIMDYLKKRNVKKLAIIQFGAMQLSVKGAIYNHGIERILETEKGGRMFSIVTDRSNLLQGVIDGEKDTVRGVYTSHHSLVEMAIDYMTHEIYTTKMYDKFAEEMDKKFGGKDLKKLRNIWKP